MNCRSAEPLLSAFLEDGLSQNERRDLEAHLLSCRRCSHGLRELRATLELLHAVPDVETSPHFEADVLARIRSGEGLRPSVIEWVRGYLMPARLRPVFLAGAGACAIWIAAVLVGSNSPFHAASPELASQTAPAAPAQVVTTPEVASAPATKQNPAVIASQPKATKASRSQASGAGEPGYALADPGTPAMAGRDTVISNPGNRYDDEYVNDQFIIQRGFQDTNNRTITPVSDQKSDDVFIVF
ncbi:MAG: anti-sigma factor family protein [Candidatus Eiseniibacteriota bacterium]